MENEKALILKKKLRRLELRSLKLDNEISSTKNELQEICIHNDIKILDEYISGGYLERSQYIKKEVCDICNKELRKKITLGYFE